MIADFKVVIDACVLADFGVCDLFLRLAEKPRLFLPQWSEELLDEVQNVHQQKLIPPWPKAISDSWRNAANQAFPTAMVADYDHIIPALKNDPKDRHVLAVAIRSGAGIIITYNLKDFPEDALSPWKVEACHPQDYLLTLYSMAPELIVQRLNDIARKKNLPMVDVLLKLGMKSRLPNFCAHLIDDLELEI